MYNEFLTQLIIEKLTNEKSKANPAAALADPIIHLKGLDICQFHSAAILFFRDWRLYLPGGKCGCEHTTDAGRNETASRLCRRSAEPQPTASLIRPMPEIAGRCSERRRWPQNTILRRSVPIEASPRGRQNMKQLKKANGGQGGIRTHGTLSRTHAFQACALNHSATCPWLLCVV